MCVVSMVIDFYDDKWRPWPTFPGPYVPVPESPTVIPPPVKIPSQEEIDEFYKLLERAREYDKKTGQPDCALEEKKQKLIKLADELGVKISFE